MTYNHLQINAFAVVSDSGTLPEESSFFLSIGNPIPAVCIRHKYGTSRGIGQRKLYLGWHHDGAGTASGGCGC